MHEKHEQRRLEELGIDFGSTFDLREKPSLPDTTAMSLQQVTPKKQ